MGYKTGTEIKLLANSLTEGDIIDDDNALIWINEFLEYKLRDKAYIRDFQDLDNVKAKEVQYLDSNAERIHRVMRYSNETMEDREYISDYAGYDQNDDEITFENDGHYRIWFFRSPKPIDTLADEIKINSFFYEPCALWLAYRYMTNDDEDNARGQSLGQLRLQEFWQSLNEATAAVRGRFSKRHQIRRVNYGAF